MAVKRFKTTAAAAIALTGSLGLVAVLPAGSAADTTTTATTTTTTTTTNPAVTAPPVQGTTPRKVTMYVDTVAATFHGTVPAGAVQGACNVTHHFSQGQTVVFRMWGTAADGSPLIGPNATNGGNVKSATVTIQTPGGGSKTVALSYASHPSGASYWTAPWPTSTSTPTGTVNYSVSVVTYAVSPVYKPGFKVRYKLAYRKVNGHRKAYLKRVRKPIKVLVSAGVPGETATFSSSDTPDLPDSSLTIVAQGTAPTSW